MGSLVGVLKIAATRVGLSIEEYQHRIKDGLKHCTKCKGWKRRSFFDQDRTRGDGLTAVCIDCRRVRVRMRRIGGAPNKQVQQAAVDAVRFAIRMGRLCSPTMLPCFDCGAAAMQYHHHLGYDKNHLLDVVALCVSCHQRRHWM